MRRNTGCASRAGAVIVAVALAVLVTTTAAACAGTGGRAGLLEGSVTLGPIDPVEQPGASPNVRPYAATIDIARPEGGIVATVLSGADGRFSVRLAEGSYRLFPRTPQGQPLPSASPVDVTVTADRTTTVTIAYDSGIRLPD